MLDWIGLDWIEMVWKPLASKNYEKTFKLIDEFKLCLTTNIEEAFYL
jgi:hypothetical protein